MGNTKMAFFEGVVKGKAPTEQELLDETHGNYAAVSVRKGVYLDPEPDELFMIGALESSSLLFPGEAIAKHIHEGTVQVTDTTNGDVYYWEIEDGKIAQRWVGSLDEEPKRKGGRDE